MRRTSFAAAALSLLGAVTACSDDSRTGEPPLAPSPPVAPTTGPAVSTEGPLGSAARLTLIGRELGITVLGAEFQGAVKAISVFLGPPVADPASGRQCLDSSSEVAWTGFRVGERDGILVGWVSTSKALSTDFGVTVGSTREALGRAYGPDVSVIDAVTAGAGNAFSVLRVGLAGDLDDAGRVSALFSGDCGPG